MKTKMNIKKYRFGELFCGAGGLSLGAAIACYKGDRVEPLWAIDNSKDACTTHKANLRGEVYCEDVRDVDFRLLPHIDCLAFGFPCNDFSIIGEKKGLKGKYGALYLECVRALQDLTPKWFIAENVGGLLRQGALQVCIEAFEQCGYTVYSKLIDFSHLGVPQRRKRYILVGFRNDINCAFTFPDESLYEHVDISARTALEVPPIPDDAKNNERSTPSKRVRERLACIPVGGYLYSKEVPDEVKTNCKMQMGASYRKLDPNKPSRTIIASNGGGLTPFHWSELRALTNRELARLQTFPDSFEFYGTRASVHKQIGMAVPPQAASILIEKILETLH